MNAEIEAGLNASDLLERFERVATISGSMLAAARQGAWGEVDRLAGVAGIVINEVRALSIGLTLTAEERQRKLACMQRILANDALIRELSQPWLTRLSFACALPIRPRSE